MRNHLIVAVCATLALAACKEQTHVPARAHTSIVASEPVPLGELPRTVVPNRYRIALTVDPRTQDFSGHAEIDVTFTEKRRSIFLHGRDLNVLGASVRLNARHSIPAHYMQVDKTGVARLIFVDEVPAGKATLVFDYDSAFGKTLSGLYKVIDRGDAYAFTQFESTSAREAFPSFDEPGFKTPFQLEVTAPADDKVVSNTPIQSVSHTPNGMNATLFEWTRPLPTYLVALAVGPLDIVDAGDIPPDAERNRPVHLRGVTARGNGARMRYALSLTPKIVLALENYFGVAYPFQKLDVLAVPDFAAGAMENAGAITFRERLLLLDPDASIEQKRSSLAVQAHELTHQWFGDLVTPAWWDDIWLNESFADWMENKIAQTVLPSGEFDTETLRGGLQVMERDELASAREIHQPVRNADDIENAFDAITYDKGAAVLSMFESYLGDDLFRKGIHVYLTKFASRNASAKDFLASIAAAAAAGPHARPEDVAIKIDAAGDVTWNGHAVQGMAALMDQLSHMSAATSPQQLTSAFASFIDQSGVPLLRVRLECDGAASAQVTQSVYSPIGMRAAPRAWKVPACLSVAGKEKYCRLADRRSTTVLLGAVCPQALMPNDEGKGYFRFAVDDAERSMLIRDIASMDSAQQITILYNLDSALRSGDAVAADLLHAVQDVAPTARWDVLDAIDEILHRLRAESGLAPADLGAYRSIIARQFASRMTSVGYRGSADETPGVSLEREKLAILLVSEARDPATIAALAQRAQAVVNGVPGVLPRELDGETMRAGLFTQGAPFAQLLVRAFETSRDESFRRQIAYAFAGSDDPSVIKSFLSLALTPHMRAGELRYLFQFMSEEPVAAATLWSWYKGNFSALLARLSRDGMGRAPGILKFACDMQSRNDVDAFFAPQLATLTGTARPLALVEQQISRCIAFRQAKAAEVATALQTLSR